MTLLAAQHDALDVRAPSARVANRLVAEAGVVVLHSAAEPAASLMLAHGLDGLLSDDPGNVVRHAHVAPAVTFDVAHSTAYRAVSASADSLEGRPR